MSSMNSCSARLGVLVAAAVFMTGVSQGAAPAAAAGPAQRLVDVVIPGAAANAIHEKHLLRFDVAEKIAKACFAFATRNQLQVSVRILNQFGDTIFAGRMDGQSAINIDTAEMKAKTALYFREPSSVWMDRSQASPTMALWMVQLNQFANAGGLPIIVDGQMLGAIGVGGAPGGRIDERCAHEALSVVLGPQPALPAPPTPAAGK